MIRTLTKAFWLLALCAVFDAIQAAMNLLMMLSLPGGSVALRRFAIPDTVSAMAMLALASGLAAIAVGLAASGKGHSWLLSLHGLALSAFGLIGLSPLIKGPLSFRPVSLLFILMAVSIGAFTLATASLQTNRAGDKWFLRAAGAVSLGFAFSYFVVGFNFVRLAAPSSFWIWMSSYFAFCAIVMLWLALHARPKPDETVPPAPATTYPPSQLFGAP